MLNLNQIKNRYSPKTLTPAMQSGNSCGNHLSVQGSSGNGGDMSRRKQKNPKPFFTSSEEQDGENQERDNDGQNNNLNSRYLYNIFFF
jgi:hypothetical protein